MNLYVPIVVIILIVFMQIYVKICHPFWYQQPCFHFFNVFNYFRKPNFILLEPLRNKYCNFTNITTKNFSQITEIDTQHIVSLINNHFLKNGDNFFVINSANFLTCFNGTCKTSFASMYFNHRPLQIGNEVKNDKYTQLVGVITSQTITINFLKDQLKIGVNLVDNLCIHKCFRKRGIAEQLIQTHNYNQQTKNTSIKVSLFKREGSIMIIRPFIFYRSFFRYTHNISYDKDQVDFVIEICNESNKNLHMFFDFLQKETLQFDCFIEMHTATLLEMIQYNLLYIFILRSDTQVSAIYCFKNPLTYSNKREKMILCIGSIKHKSLSKTQFQIGFEIALQQLSSSFEIAVIENISHNYHLIKKTDIRFIDMSYFLYNYIHCGYNSSKVFCLC